MSVFLDIAGSFLIGAFVILIGLRLNATTAGNATALNAQLNVQESALDLMRTLNSDFQKIGNNCFEPSTSILFFDTAAGIIRFRGNIQQRQIGTLEQGIDTVEWRLGPTLTGYENPNIRNLFRTVNGGTPVPAGMWVTSFDLAGYDKNGSLTTDRASIEVFQVTVGVENPYMTQDQVNQDTTSYARIFLTRKWAPQGLMR